MAQAQIHLVNSLPLSGVQEMKVKIPRRQYATIEREAKLTGTSVDDYLKKCIGDRVAVSGREKMQMAYLGAALLKMRKLWHAIRSDAGQPTSGFAWLRHFRRNLLALLGEGERFQLIQYFHRIAALPDIFAVLDDGSHRKKAVNRIMSAAQGELPRYPNREGRSMQD